MTLANTPGHEGPDDKATRRDAQIRVKNRRRLYLERHPEYFTNPDLELADPLLFDRCVRHFWTPAEREKDGRAKGYSGVLEADLYRSEAKLAALANKKETLQQTTDVSTDSAEESVPNGKDAPNGRDSERESMSPEDPEEVPSNKEEGQARWEYEMGLCFTKGEDPDFSYENVDNSDEWDVIEAREAEEKWFDDEEPEWESKSPSDENQRGETGVQDF